MEVRLRFECGRETFRLRWIASSMWGWASTLTSAALIATFFGMNLTRYVDLDDIIPIEYVIYLPYVKNADVILLVFF